MNDNFKKLSPEGEKILKNKGIDPKSVSEEQVKGILKSLSPEDTKKLGALLSDKAALEQILSSGKAQMLLKMFMGGGKGR